MISLLGKKKVDPGPPVSETIDDPTAWLIDSGLAEFLLLHTSEMRYMAMLCYTFLHGVKLYPNFPPNTSKSYKLAALALQCTGGGILVPIFINSIPVTLGTDAYPICIFLSFLLHTYLPVVREVCKISPIFHTAMIIMYECQRALVVCKLTKLAGANIPASDFSFPVLGPIICGGIGGCGGAFLPMSKGLDPIKNGLAQPMYSALIAAAFFHLFLHTRLSDGVVDAADKARVLIVVFFIALHLSSAFPSSKPPPTTSASPDSKKHL